MATTTNTAARTDTANTTGTSAAEAQPFAAHLPGVRSAHPWVTLARLLRPQGRHGELLAEILTDFPERFSERRRLFLQLPDADAPHSEVTLKEHWLHKGRLVLKFTGIDSIEQAGALRDLDVVIPREERAPLDEDSVYISDLAGCLFFDRATAREIGEILDVDRESANLPLIVIRGTGGQEILVPFAKAYAPVVDLANRRMEMTLPDGLLTLAAPPTSEELATAAAADLRAANDLQHATDPQALPPCASASPAHAAPPAPRRRSANNRRRKPGA